MLRRLDGIPDFLSYDTARVANQEIRSTRRAEMNEVTIWHNPRCSKSRQTLELLREKGHDPRVVRYLDDAPSASAIRKVLKMLGCQPRGLMRTKESLYEELGLAKIEDSKRLIQAMVENPKLIERPIVICGDRAAIGRPPENVLSVLQ